MLKKKNSFYNAISFFFLSRGGLTDEHFHVLRGDTDEYTHTRAHIYIYRDTRRSTKLKWEEFIFGSLVMEKKNGTKRTHLLVLSLLLFYHLTQWVITTGVCMRAMLGVVAGSGERGVLPAELLKPLYGFAGERPLHILVSHRLSEFLLSQWEGPPTFELLNCPQYKSRPPKRKKKEKKSHWILLP